MKIPLQLQKKSHTVARPTYRGKIVNASFQFYKPASRISFALLEPLFQGNIEKVEFIVGKRLAELAAHGVAVFVVVEQTSVLLQGGGLAFQGVV